MNQSSLGKLFAYAGLAMVVLTVLAFLGLHTLNFFAWTFPPEQAIYRPLGFALTGGAFIVYLLVFKYLAKTPLLQFISLGMIIITGLGELAAAGFGMQVEAYRQANITFTKEEIDLMIWAIRALGGLHAIALTLEFIGDDIGKAWAARGTPIDDTVFDRRAESHRYQQTTPAPSLDEDSRPISDDEKRMYAPGTHFRDGTITPTDLSDPFWSEHPHHMGERWGKEQGATPSPFLKSNPE